MKGNRQVIEIDRDARLYVEQNMSGADVVRAYGTSFFCEGYNDLIHLNIIGDVTLYEFERGEVIIKIQGRRMTENDLHYGRR